MTPRSCSCSSPWLEADWHCCRCGYDRPVPGVAEVMNMAAALDVPWTVEQARIDVLRYGLARAVGRVVAQRRQRLRQRAELPPRCERPDPWARALYVDAAGLVAWLKDRGLYEGLRAHAYGESRLKKWSGPVTLATVWSVDRALTLCGTHLTELPASLFVAPTDPQLSLEAERVAA